jgi:hypothetical protein
MRSTQGRIQSGPEGDLAQDLFLSQVGANALDRVEHDRKAVIMRCALPYSEGFGFNYPLGCTAGGLGNCVGMERYGQLGTAPINYRS